MNHIGKKYQDVQRDLSSSMGINEDISCLLCSFQNFHIFYIEQAFVIESQLILILFKIN